MTNKQRFLDAQRAYNRRMTNRRERKWRALFVRIIFFSSVILAVAMIAGSVVPDFRYHIGLAVARVFSLFGLGL